MKIGIIQSNTTTAIFLMALIAGCCLLMAANETTARIAVVDINRIIEESSYVQNTIAEISVEAKELSKKLESKGQEYETERQKLESQKSLLNESERQARIAQLQKLSDEFDELKFFFNRELQKTQERGLGPIREKIQLMIEDLSRVRGIDLVLSSSNAVYHSSKIDLTAEIIASLDN